MHIDEIVGKGKITLKELQSVIGQLQYATFGHKFKNSVICFHCDNSSVVEILDKQSCKDEIMMAMVRKLVLKLLELKTTFYSVHIPGIQNHLYDAHSRF